jgi:hypothetical protein
MAYMKEIINVMNSREVYGLQLSKRIGIISSTWLLYKKQSFFYYFDINQKIEFIDIFKYTKDELIREFQNSIYEIDFSID